jgi:hypothetical protein
MNVFDLGIRHAVLDRGEIYYNNRKSVLSADLHEMNFHASFDPLLTKYDGTISYIDGQLISGTFQPIPHNFTAHFDATPTTFHLTSAKLSSGASQVTLTATVQHYSNPIVQAHYDASVDGAAVRDILKNTAIPTGVIHASGLLNYAALPDQPALNAVSLQGDVNSTQLNVRSAGLRTQIRNIVGHYSLIRGDVTLLDFKASLLGGLLSAQGEMNDLAGNTHSKLSADLRGLSLSDLKRTFESTGLPNNIAISGGVSGRVTGTWGKNLDDLTAEADAIVHGKLGITNPEPRIRPLLPSSPRRSAVRLQAASPGSRVSHNFPSAPYCRVAAVRAPRGRISRSNSASLETSS